MFRIFAQGTFYIFHNVVVVLRHLAADDIRAFIFRRTDNSAFQYGMGGQCKVINGNGNVTALGRGKERVFYQKGKTVCTDIV